MPVFKQLKFHIGSTNKLKQYFKTQIQLETSTINKTGHYFTSYNWAYDDIGQLEVYQNIP